MKKSRRLTHEQFDRMVDKALTEYNSWLNELTTWQRDLIPLPQENPPS